MHGLGNDFVVLDARTTPLVLTPETIRALADRHTGIGCDQLITLTPGEGGETGMSIHNADGSEVGACGNATRCVGWLLMEEGASDHALIRTKAGRLEAWRAGDHRVTVDMGPARLDWRAIPVAEAGDTLYLPVAAGPLSDPVGVGMGNPHAVFFVDDAEAVDLAALGPVIEHHPFFPERVNVEVAHIVDAGRIRMRVWERGAGITQACGTGACATLVAAARRGLTGRTAVIELDGGSLDITWRDDGHVRMTGAVAAPFAGRLP